MTQMRSSSNRGVNPCDAVVITDEKVSGPIRLPGHRADDFVAHFNRKYRGLAMSLVLLSDLETDTKNPRQSED